MPEGSPRPDAAADGASIPPATPAPPQRRPGRTWRRRLWRAGAVVVGLPVLALVVGGVWFYARLQASLPILDGDHGFAELAAPVSIDRDAQGVPTVTARTRADLAFATGFLHAQERFFQMDLLRRTAAGELGALLGAPALELDRRLRVHRFRYRAGRVIAALDAPARAIFDAYTHGVNAGLNALDAAPFEYLLLRADAEPWKAEDTALVIYAMFLTLQDPRGRMERLRGLAYDALDPALADFLFPLGTSWDAPIMGGPLPAPPMPGPDVVDVRTAPADQRTGFLAPEAAEPPPHGSNNWAVAGALTAHGAAMVANDMHLGIRVPNTWYRARLVVAPDGETDAAIDVVGVSLPGAPIIVVGSNGRVAWGFTNAQIDTVDIVALDMLDADAGTYAGPDGPRTIERIEERLCARGGTCETLVVEQTVWGPVIDTDPAGRPLVSRWVAHDPGAVDFEFIGMETATSVDEALAVVTRSGIPSQNVVLADDAGAIAWTVSGTIPKRFGHTGRTPQSWADGSRGWNGHLSPAEVPRVVNPAGHRLWTANARVVNGVALDRIGFGHYALGARAHQIRDALFTLDRVDETDLLAVQLDDRAVFLERWRALLLRHLDGLEGQDARRRALIPHVTDWDGRAEPASVGYRIVRQFRRHVVDFATAGANTIVAAALPTKTDGDDGTDDITNDITNDITLARYRQIEGPVWRLVTERPTHLLDADFDSWDALLTEAVDRVLEEVDTQAGGDLEQFRWGVVNPARVRHPLSGFVPLLGRLTDPPEREMPGDRGFIPRAQMPGFGASQRLVVAPGHEDEGLFHMPTGQSGNPLSPYYNAGHEDWVVGRATPLLPGHTRHAMRLVPTPP